MTMPTTYGAPGIYFSTQLIGPTPPAQTTSPSVAGFSGEHWRGPSGAVQCNSWSDFVKYFGGFNPNPTPVLANPYLPYAVNEYFANGGQSAWIQRVAASASAGSTATVTLKDSSATPQNTLTLTAGVLGVSGNVGTWGNNLYVSVVANGTGRFNLNVYYGGITNAALVESWNSLSMTVTDPRYVVNIVNSPQQGSLWIVATNLSDASAYPSNTPAPIASAQFSGGIDAGDPSSADRVAAIAYGTGGCAFDQVQGVLNFNLPGETTQAVVDAAILYAQQRPYTFCVIDTPSGQTPAGAVSYFGGLSPVSPNAAIYYPWLYSSNPANSSLQSSILLPPGGFVLGQYVSNDAAYGVWTAPAGLGTEMANVLQAERKFSPGDLGTLNSNNVNALRTRPTGQVVIWGTRTMATGYATLYVPVQRTLNFIEATLAHLLEFVIFQPNDYMLWSNITAIINNFLGNLYTAGAFQGTSAVTSYYVICNTTNNTPQTISQGIVNATAGVALVTPAEFIQLTIAQFQSTGVTSVTANV